MIAPSAKQIVRLQKIVSGRSRGGSAGTLLESAGDCRVKLDPLEELLVAGYTMVV